MKGAFKVGDLVRILTSGVEDGATGLIVKIEPTLGGYDPIIHVQWALNGTILKLYKEEIEVISGSR